MITWRIFEYDGAGFYQAIGSVEAMTHDAASALAYARFHTCTHFQILNDAEWH